MRVIKAEMIKGEKWLREDEKGAKGDVVRRREKKGEEKTRQQKGNEMRRREEIREIMKEVIGEGIRM